jgi:hypothetical protein
MLEASNLARADQVTAFIDEIIVLDLAGIAGRKVSEKGLSVAEIRLQSTGHSPNHPEVDSSSRDPTDQPNHVQRNEIYRTRPMLTRCPVEECPGLAYLCP